MDRTIVVYADVEQQIERLSLRDHLSREQALSRIASQMPLSEKRGHADHVIDNTGTRADTERQARELFKQLKEETKRI
jgi:dephospho-CoA kinase